MESEIDMPRSPIVEATPVLLGERGWCEQGVVVVVVVAVVVAGVVVVVVVVVCNQSSLKNLEQNERVILGNMLI